MTALEFSNQLAPITENQLIDLEAELEVTLPNDYRDFLLQYNGGTLKSTYLFPIRENPRDTHGTLGFLYGIDKDKWDYNDLRNQFVEAGERFPAEILPIGHDPGGNKIGLAIKGPLKGTVYFWDLDDEAIDEPPSYDKLYLVTPTFADFIKSLELKDL